MLIMRAKDIYWLAGILEGEGCFNLARNSIQVRCGMTDKDTIEKISLLLQSKIYTGHTPAGKPYYSVQIGGVQAYQIMCTIYSLMSIRRKTKILSIVTDWLNNWPQLLTRNALGQFEKRQKVNQRKEWLADEAYYMRAEENDAEDHRN